jgi:hypothetical protein
MLRSHARGIAAAVATLLLAPLLLEGGASLFTGTPLSERLLARGRPGRATPADATPAGGAALTPGPYALSSDPEVGFTLKRGFTASFEGVDATTDAFGMRVRLGPPPAPGAPRVVLLGDSIAFGLGVSDADAPAQQLEAMLRAAARPDSPPPAVFSVACPGWNRRAAFRYLRDHIERLDPDVVVFVLVNNDLDDTTVVNELGWRRIGAGPDPRFPQASSESALRLHRTLEHLPPRAATLEVVLAGGPRVIENVLRSGVTPESERRWDELCAETAAFAAELAARDTRFAVALSFDTDFHRQAEVRLARGASGVPVWGLSSGATPADSLPTDSHYNAATTREHARRTAQHLIAAGWLQDSDASRLPPPAEGFAERVYAPLAPAEREPFLRALHDEYRAFVRAAVDVARVEGIHQVYGGLDGDGTVGRAVFAALSNPGATRLELRLLRLPRDSGVYPLELTATLGATELGRRPVPPPPADDADDEPFVLAFDVPAALRDARVLDVLVTASAWIEEPGPPSEPAPRLASFRLRRMALVAD